MNIDTATIDKIAQLSRLEFNEQEKIDIKNDLENMVDFIDTLKGIDTEGIAPLIYVSDARNVMRPDVANNNLTKNEALLLAPLKDSDYIKVTKVIK